MLYGIGAGLIVFGAASLLTWLIYDSPVIIDHAISLVILAGLMVAAGLAANPVLTWLSEAGAVSYRAQTDASDTSPAYEDTSQNAVTYRAVASNAATAPRRRRLSQGRTQQR
ncbi:hypothetical protein ALI144C_52860 [Actinosynnema sp. ALI-1.44]|uniref:hypothetical protein n=1 Tax=Actinosynnema sp. ALI-1.44 TaxID=1933779 RepID=UPI00097CA53A|nr:hypothetical protein [Actinosynnema sp. ALI-1.44]ONI71211.1 hypothetical protein ALI144C_52860 [Actinosynnema sp. ALI-1.44]